MWKQSDFCDADTGFDYVFARMNAVYGAMFQNNWKNVDADIIRQTWKEICGIGLTYRPKMDYALQYMNPERPPSALQFAKLLNEAPRIPDKPDFHIAQQKTQAELAQEKQRGEEARKKLSEMLEKMRMK
jgi:hypothetical protein